MAPTRTDRPRPPPEAVGLEADARAQPDQLAQWTRVVKTLWPAQQGTKKLVRRFGDALLCVRYRQDPSGLRRYTTVELVVDEAPVTGRRADQRLFLIRIGPFEKGVRGLALEHGAQWDDTSKTWTMTGASIKRLGFEQRVIRRVREK